MLTQLEPLLEEVPECPICQCDQRQEMFRDPPFRVLQCTQCQLVYVSPRLPYEALGLVYTEPYWTSPDPTVRGYSNYRAEGDQYLKTFRQRYRHLANLKPGRALDIGCAAGYFLRVLAENGWEACGVDISSAITQDLANEFPIHLGPLTEAPWPKHSFDLISLWDVIEHVPDPRTFLEQTVWLLRPGGTLILETQNVESWYARLMGRRWHHYKHWEHLLHFSPGTLEQLLQSCGLRTVLSTTRYAGKFVALGYIRQQLSRAFPLLRPLLKPLARLDRHHLYINPKDELIVVVQKPASN